MRLTPPSFPSGADVSGHTERMRLWLRNFLPTPTRVHGRELLRMVVGVALGVGISAFLSHWWSGGVEAPWMFAALGASALLLFCVPSSPMAQPWPVVAGGTVSALVGWACVLVFRDPILSPAMAVALSVLAMVLLRCLHPPGAALAMWMSLNHLHDLHLLLFPVLFNLVVLVLLAVVYNTLTGKRYPAPQHSQPGAVHEPGSAEIVGADLDEALAQFDGVLDVSRADLEALLHVASHAAFKRTLGELRGADIMSQPVHAVEPGVLPKDAWALMQKAHVKALPVVDAGMRVVGIVTATDFLNHELNEAPAPGIAQRLKSLVRREAVAAKTVADLMSHEVTTAQQDTRAVELIAVFSTGSHHHLPVIDAEHRLVGMITQSDLVKVLAKAVSPG
ncbi:HPP family protein [Comamonas humi]